MTKNFLAQGTHASGVLKSETRNRHAGSVRTELRSRLRISGAGCLLLLSVLLLSSCASGNSSEGLGTLPKAVSKVDETSAIQTLRTIATAQTQSRAVRGAYGDFNSLVQAGFLDDRFRADSPNLRGYRFVMKTTDTEFSVNADPEITEAQPTTGARHFYLDSTDNAIHVNQTQAASKTDPTL
jgi:hypothetical protein